MLDFIRVSWQNEVKDDKTFYIAESHELTKSFLITFFLFILFLLPKFQNSSKIIYKKNLLSKSHFILNFQLKITIPWYMVIYLIPVHFHYVLIRMIKNVTFFYTLVFSNEPPGRKTA